MNSLERVSLILQHKEVDYVPVYPLINSISRNYTGIDYATWTQNTELCAESILKATEDLDLDVICSLVDLSVEAADFGQEVEYPKNDAARPVYGSKVIRSIDEYKNVEPINPRITPRMSEHIRLCDLLVKAKGKEKPVVAFVFGPLGIVSMMRGQQDMFMDVLDDPDTIHIALEAITQTLIEYCSALMETGVHAIMFDTLYASQSIMSKSMWDALEGPYMERLAKHVHDNGCMVMIHNCGNGIYFDVQIKRMQPEAISFLHVPDDCTSYADMKEKYGKKTTLIGHVPPSLIVSATAQEIEEECKKEIDIFKKDGGFILATGCEYPANASPDNARVMVKTAQTYGRY
ncbi:MAG TPA: uroporphyrinogen decarboxylase family protein [Clostridia bacterium]|nr:uroporphyrinogen decarboxylase family protein [Clostridia bacterium]